MEDVLVLILITQMFPTQLCGVEYKPVPRRQLESRGVEEMVIWPCDSVSLVAHAPSAMACHFSLFCDFLVSLLRQCPWMHIGEGVQSCRFW